MDLFSLAFVIFLFVSLLVFFIVGAINRKLKKRLMPQWTVLLVASVVFYALANVISLAYIVLSSLIAWLIGYLVQHKMFHPESQLTSGGQSERVEVLSPVYLEDHEKRKRYENALTAIAIVVNVGVLAVLKYFNFLVLNFNGLFKTSFPLYDFLIPIGLSFYTFTLIGYSVDTNKRTVKAEVNFLKFFLFVSYFPKVMQGPISSYDRLREDGLFDEHGFSEISFRPAFLRLAVGVLKKIAIANVIGTLVDLIYAHYGELNGAILFLGTILYSIQLYCDFSGFMDIVIGVSGLFGIRLEENFNMPYLSASTREFWRRWHITLGAWLRKYIYIPLGGNRVKTWRWMLNILAVWLVTGIWHGANWTFVLWGLYYFLIMVISKLLAPVRDKAKKLLKLEGHKTVLRILGIALTFTIVNFGWILFRSPSIADAGLYFAGLFKYAPVTFDVFAAVPYHYAYFIAAALSMIALIVGKTLYLHGDKIRTRLKRLSVLNNVAAYVAICFCVSFSIYMIIYSGSLGGSESTFIYFNF